MRPLPLLFVLACGPHRVATALPDATAPTVYRVGVAAASGTRTVTSIYTLRVVPRGDGVYAFTTVDAEGTWEEGQASLAWDSRTPSGRDPWPVTIQHAIATVPAQVRLGDDGMPIALSDEQTWRSAASASVAAAGLPDEAQASAAAMLDADGYLRDLRRDFPGAPSPNGTWAREELLAGLPAQRVETCSRSARAGTVTYDCSGRVEGPTDGNARLVDTTSSTRLVVDRRGVVEMSSSYEGTMVVLAPDGRAALDRAIVGQRKVVRQ
jgi:hypothetical protein